MNIKEANLKSVENNKGNWVSIDQIDALLDLDVSPFREPIILIINSKLGYLPIERNGVMTYHIDAFKFSYPQFNYELKNKLD